MSYYKRKPCQNNPELCECRICWLYLHDENANRAYGGNGVTNYQKTGSMLSRFKNPCIYQGQRILDDNSCGCNKPPIYECSKFGTCKKTLNGESGIRSCLNCEAYKSGNGGG